MQDFTKQTNFQEGTVLYIDKPLEWSSFDVVNKIRNLIRKRLGIKWIKVGHAGTLDPLATGLMIVCTGNQTKNIQYYLNHDKEYLATICLGKTTPSFDLETEVENLFAIGDGAGITRGLLQASASGILAARTIAKRLNLASS